MTSKYCYDLKVAKKKWIRRDATNLLTYHRFQIQQQHSSFCSFSPLRTQQHSSTFAPARQWNLSLGLSGMTLFCPFWGHTPLLSMNLSPSNYRSPRVRWGRIKDHLRKPLENPHKLLSSTWSLAEEKNQSLQRQTGKNINRKMVKETKKWLLFSL